MINGTSLNICSEICQRCNEISFLRSGAKSIGDRYPLSFPPNESPAQLCFIPGKTHFSQITFLMNSSHTEDKKQVTDSSAALFLAKTPAAVTQICTTHVFPKFTTMELSELCNWFIKRS